MNTDTGGSRDRYEVSFGTALGWSYVMRGGQYAISTVVTFVMAAILGPTVFGLVAMALVYLMFVQLILRQGMVPALVQRRELDERHLDSAFWLTVAGGVTLTTASLLLSGWWADVNRTPELEQVINVMSMLIPLQALVVVQEAYLSRHMDFKGLAMRTNSAALVGGVVGLVMALTGFGVWALVAQHIVKALVDVVVLWTLSEWRPRMAFSAAATKDILSFSSLTAFAGFGTFVSSRADALLIGLLFGPTAVGLYRLAARVVEIVSYVTTSAFQAVSLPELSRLEHDRALFAGRVTNLLKLAALVSFPPLAILAGTSTQLMAVLGAEWQAAAAPLSVLCIVGAVLALTIFTGPILLAVGEPKVYVLVTWVSACLSAGSFVLAGILLGDAPIGGQVLGVAWARVAVFATVVLAIATWAIVKYADTRLASLVRVVIPASLAAMVGYAATQILDTVPWGFGDFGRLLIVAVPSALLTLGVLWKAEPMVRDVLRRAIRRLRRSKTVRDANGSSE